MGRRDVSTKSRKKLIKHSFKKYGLSNNLDGKEDALININGIEGFKLPLSEMDLRNSQTT